MALELATAFVRVKTSSAQISSDFLKARRRIAKILSPVPVLIVPKVHQGALRNVQNTLESLNVRSQLSGVGGRGRNGGAGRVFAAAGGGGGSRGGGFGTRPLPSPGSGGGGFLPTGPSGAKTTMSGASRVRSGGLLFGGNLAGFAKTSGQIAAGILGAQAALGAFSIPVVAIRTTADFEQSMVRLGAVTNATDSELQILRQTALDLAGTTKFTATEIGNAFVVLAQKGLSAKEVEETSDAVTSFAAAARVDLEKASTTLVNIMNAMQLGTNDLVRVTDVLTRTALRSSADVSSVGEAFKFVGPLADLAGQSIEEVASVLALLSNVGLGGSIGGTGFKRIIGGLLDPAHLKKLEKQLGKTFDFRDEMGNLKDFADIIDEVNAAFPETATGADKAALALSVFGQRAGPQFAALLQKGGDELRRLQRVMKDTSITARGIAEDEMNTLTGSFLKLKSALEKLLIDATSPFKEDLKDIIELLTMGVNAAGTFTKAMDEMKSGLLTVIGISPEILQLIKAGLEAQKKLEAGMKLTPDDVQAFINTPQGRVPLSEPTLKERSEAFVRRRRERERERELERESEKKAMAKSNIFEIAAKAAGIKKGQFVPEERRGFGGVFLPPEKPEPEPEQELDRFRVRSAIEASSLIGESIKRPEVVQKKMRDFEPRFVGIEELHKQIQLGLMKKDDAVEKNTKQTAENTSTGNEHLSRIEEKIGEGAVFR